MADPDFTEYQFRVNKLRLSFKIRNRQQHQAADQVQEIPGQLSPVHPAFRVQPQITQHSSERNFRPRLSSTSSVASNDSGVAGLRPTVSRTSSGASRTGGILRRIARLKEATKSADAEFEGFYRRPVSRTSSTASSGVSTSFTASSRQRSKSCSAAGRSRIVSDDSSYADYSDLYDEEEEYADPFEDDHPPPLPPRRAVLRAPALPPYPSTAVTVVNDIAKTILC